MTHVKSYKLGVAERDQVISRFQQNPLSVILARLARRKKGEESEPEPAPATPLAKTATPEAAPVTPAVWTGPLGTPDDPITIDIDLAQ